MELTHNYTLKLEKIGKLSKEHVSLRSATEEITSNLSLPDTLYTLFVCLSFQNEQPELTRMGGK